MAELSRRWLIGGGLLVAAAGVGYFAGGRELYYAAITDPVSGGQIDAETAHRLAEAGEITLVDIRRPDEWELTGSGAGAIRLDMRRDDFVDELTTLVDGDRTAPIALICARGVRSARLSNQLTSAGFTQIIDVPEGMLGSRAGPGWLKRGLPVEKG